MAETEGRAKQDIGQDEAYIVNLKKIVEEAQDISGRNRIYFDAIAQSIISSAQNLSVSMGAINSQIVAMVKQGVTVTTKQDENITGVNETDHIVGQILNSPWAEAMKTLMAQVMTAESDKKK